VGNRCRCPQGLSTALTILAGARRRPEPGEPTYGLYEHKRSFGAEWVGLVGAQERASRPWRYAAGRATSAVARRLGPGTGR